MQNTSIWIYKKNKSRDESQLAAARCAVSAFFWCGRFPTQLQALHGASALRRRRLGVK
jgi:hypothetical protein